jgi:hypothetical protein
MADRFGVPEMGECAPAPALEVHRVKGQVRKLRLGGRGWASCGGDIEGTLRESCIAARCQRFGRRAV